MGPGGPGPRFDLPFRLVGAYPAPGPGAIGGCAPPYPAVPFCSHKKERKMRQDHTVLEPLGVGLL